MNCNIFSAATTNYIWMLKIICAGLYIFKRRDYKYTYHILLDTDDLTQYEQEFKQFQQEDFEVNLLKLSDWSGKVVQYNKKAILFSRCLLASMFPTVEKMLYLDVDVAVVQRGVDDLFDYDLKEHYALAALDIPIQFNNPRQMKNVGVKTYFNAGVMLLNLAQIRKDGLDKVLEQDCIKYPQNLKPTLWDQTLLNYRFKQNVEIMSPVFNNTIYGLVERDRKATECYYKQLGWDDMFDSLKQTVILHFAGPKPWENVTEEAERILPHRQIGCQAILLIKDKLERAYEDKKVQAI